MSNDLLDRPTRKPSDDEDGKKPLFDKDTPQEIYDAKFQEIAALAKADRVKTPGEVKADEKKAAPGGGGTKATSTETEALDKLSGGAGSDKLNYTGGGAGKFSQMLDGLVNRKRVLSGSAFGLVFGIIFMAFSLVSPIFQIPTLAQLLQKFHFTDNEEFADGRGARYIRHLASGSAERSRLGGIGNRFGDKWEARLNNDIGLKSVYGPSPARRFIGYEITDESRAKSVLTDLERDGVNTSGRRAGVDGRFIDLSNSRAGARRSVIRTATRGTHHNKLVASLGSRLLIRRAGVDLHPLKNIKRAAGEKVSEYRDKRKKERAERRRNGVDPPNARRPIGDPDENEPPVEGESPEEADAREARNAERQASNGEGVREGSEFLDESGGLDGGSPDSNSKLKSLTKKFAAKVGGGAAAAVGILCAAKALGNEAENLQYTNTILVMLRMAMEIVATGSQMMFASNGVNGDEVGSIDDDMFDKEAKLGWMAAASIQAEMGKKPTGPDIPKDAKPSKVGEKPWLFKIIDTLPLGTACRVDSAVGNLPIIKQVGQVSGFAIDQALKLANTSIEELTQGLVKLIAGAGVNVFAQGAELGNILSYGARLAANDAIIAMGGRALSAAEELLLSQAAKEDARQQYASQSFYERVFNPYNVDSVATSVLLGMPQSPSQGFAAILNAPGSIFSSLASIGGGEAYAADEPYDYGFPQYGFSLDEERDDRFENPYDNAEILEANDYEKLAAYSEKYGDCFSMKVDAPTGNLKSGPAKRYDEIRNKAECSPTTPEEQEEYMRYRFYLADLVAAYSLTCYEGDETSCRQVGFGDSPSSPGGPGTPPGNPAGATIVGDPYTDSTTVACAAGTRDLGTGEGYRDGSSFPIRLCSLTNLPSSSAADNPGDPFSTPGADGHAVVNSRVSGAWFTLVNDAQTAGITLDVRSSYRTMAHQQYLFDRNPDPQWVARPGYSSHQAGVALDINPMEAGGGQDCAGGRAREPGNPTWEWLFNNASRYGFKQYSAEAWHWDAYPASNRCDGP